MNLATILICLLPHLVVSAPQQMSPANGDPSSLTTTCRDVHGDGGNEWAMWSCCKVSPSSVKGPNSDGKANTEVSQKTKPDLEQCLKNDGGELAAEWGGDASDSCKDCAFQWDEASKDSLFGCWCGEKGKGGKWSWIHLVCFIIVVISRVPCSYFSPMVPLSLLGGV